jgi:hypothetical protein
MALNSRLRAIGARAFAGCALTSLNVSAALAVIPANYLDDCASLTSITLTGGSTLLRIGTRAFQGCPFVSIHLPASLETVCVDGFDGHSILLSALARAFSHTAFTSFHFASGLEAISDGCFCRCENLASVTWDFDLTLTRIGSEAFARTGLTSIHLPICSKS